VAMDEFDFACESLIEIMDIGASAIAEVPIYKTLLQKQIAHLTAFDGDDRQLSKIKEAYGGENVIVRNEFLFDGLSHTVHLCSPASGMTSLFEPRKDALNFFNGFSEFGRVHNIEQIATKTLDSLDDLRCPDFLKMDVQGAELQIMKSGKETLKHCLAMQLEVSFIPLYKNQPSFGEIDVYMRGLGFVPHRFLEVKRWSIHPTVFKGNFRVPGNQLLEADIIYIKDPLNLDLLTTDQVRKLAALSHFCFKSVDLCIWMLLELVKRGVAEENITSEYVRSFRS